MLQENYPWQRLWCPPDGRIRRTDEGYLWEPGEFNKDVVTLDSLVDVPCLILLGLVVRVKKTIPLIKISGQLTLQDGRGFPEEPIQFEPANVFRHERAEVESDKDGNFEVMLPEGWTGHISAETNIYDIRFEKCEAVKKLRATRRGDTSKVPSNEITINGQKSLDNLRLTFPLPYCPPYD